MNSIMCGVFKSFFLHQYDPQLQNELLYTQNVDIYLLRSITSIMRKRGSYRTKYIFLTHPLRASLRISHFWIWTHGRLTIIIDLKWIFEEKTRQYALYKACLYFASITGRFKKKKCLPKVTKGTSM